MPDFFVVSHGLTMKADLINFSFLTSFLQVLLIIGKRNRYHLANIDKLKETLVSKHFFFAYLRSFK